MGHEDKTKNVAQAPSEPPGWAPPMTGQGHAHLAEHATGIPSQVGMRGAQMGQGMQGGLGPQESPGMQGANMQNMPGASMDGWGPAFGGAKPGGAMGESHHAREGYRMASHGGASQERGSMEAPCQYQYQYQQGMESRAAHGQWGTAQMQGSAHEYGCSGQSGQAAGAQQHGFAGQGGQPYGYGQAPACARGPYPPGGSGMEGAMYGFRASPSGPGSPRYARPGAPQPHGTPMPYGPMGMGGQHQQHSPPSWGTAMHEQCGCSGASGSAHGFAHQYGELCGLIQEAANGQPDVGRFLNFFHTVSSDFWKGALVGTALTLLLTNDQVKNFLGAGLAGLMGIMGASAEEQEAAEDRRAEQQAGKEAEA